MASQQLRPLRLLFHQQTLTMMTRSVETTPTAIGTVRDFCVGRAGGDELGAEVIVGKLDVVAVWGVAGVGSDGAATPISVADTIVGTPEEERECFRYASGNVPMFALYLGT